MEFVKELLTYVVGSLIHNSPYLGLGIMIAAIIKVYVDPEQLKTALLKKSKVSIPGSVAFGAFTPFCACGTMAVIITMLSTALPWGPIMAFLTSSPLMSPEEFVMISGMIGVKFAIALTCASVIIGLGSGYLSNLIEQKTGFLKDQIRFTASRNTAVSEYIPNVSASRKSCCSVSMQIDPVSIGCGAVCCAALPAVKADIFNPIRNFLMNIKWREI
jgi:uncharacterized membrane protein YraQ (UPF0718 family)